MSQEVSGVVQAVTSKDVSGGRKSWDIVVAGEKYGAGLYQPKVSEGQYVTFMVDTSRGYKNVERGTLKVSAHKPAKDTAPAVAAKPVANSFDNRQDAISRQAASNTAIAFLELANTLGAVNLGSSKTKGAQLEALETLLRGYEIRFYEANTGNEWKDISPKKSGGNSDGGHDDHEESPEDQPWE